MSKAAFGSPAHNGNQDAVYLAICAGHRRIDTIMQATGLDNGQVNNAIRRLFDARKIRSYDGYRPIGECVLAEVWRGVAIGNRNQTSDAESIGASQGLG